MKLKTLLMVFLSVLLLVSVTLNAADEAKPVKCPKKVNVLVEEVVPGTFQQYKVLKAAVLPGAAQNLTSPIPAAVKAIEKAAGSEVNAGDVILTLDDGVIQKEIADAKENLKKWKRILFKRSHWKVRSPKAEATAQNNIKEYEQLLIAKEEHLKKCSIIAPISGIVSILKVKIGDHISEGFHIGSVINIDKVIVPITNHVDKVNDGMALKVKVLEMKKVFKGMVKKGEGTFIVIDNPGKAIQLGMNAAFKVLLKTHEKVVVLPKAKVLKDNSGKFVYVADGKVAKKVALKTGGMHKNMVWITEGLAFGNEVIVSEVLSAKAATLKDELTCVEDGKKIKILVKNEAKGKYVKRKKGAVKLPVTTVAKKEAPKAKPVKVEPKKEKKAVKKKVTKKKTVKRRRVRAEAKPVKFRIGAHMAYSKMSSQVFEDVYGRMVTVGLDLSYFITDKIDIWVSVATGKKTATLEDFPEDGNLEFTFMPISFDVRYYFQRSDKFDFFAGAGLNYYSFEDVNPINPIKDNAIGFNLVGGGYYNVTNNISLQFALRWNSAKKTIESDIVVDNDLDLSSLEMLFGLSFGF
jgi:outer membrane protein W